MRFALACIAIAALFWFGPASAHGCHHGWQHAPKEGWHTTAQIASRVEGSASPARSRGASGERANLSHFRALEAEREPAQDAVARLGLDAVEVVRDRHADRHITRQPRVGDTKSRRKVDRVAA